MEAVEVKEKDVSGEVKKESPTKHCHKLNDNDVADENENHYKRMKSSPPSGDSVDNASGSEPPPSSASTTAAAPPGRVPEKLEVPSKELQCIQKQVMIEKLMSSPTKSSKDDKLEPMDVQSGAESSSKDKPKNLHSKRPSRGEKFQKPKDARKTFKLQSSVLDRVKTFLPTLKTANEELIRLPDPSKLSLESESDFDIDNDDTDGPVPGPSNKVPGGETKPTTSQSKTYVEMNLALVEHSDSDTSSDGEGPVLSKPLKKSLPDNLGKNENGLVEAEASSNCKITEIKESVTKTETRDG